ncbi:ROK family protein [Spirosoma utsteinense]|uniref:Glucokinase n=1 Tax=Spirosoma utsteinense TaxID=2585773 RepID=A0ABR6W3I7_9BACT|nr:ROK family protein [Spirosoma utsteinense]MBC3784813.1 glucokinase [Spirosoma utsteinense]MBC3791150.1 glucokinase [Spirosoma utsteinense]
MSSVEYLGIDVGGTNVKMGIVEADTGKISNFYSHDTMSWRQSGHFVERFGDAVALQLLANKEVKKVGIGLPGMLNTDRTVPLEITAIPEIDGMPMVDMLTKRFAGVQFFLANDANAAALGEYYFAEEKIKENYIFITLGTGVGGAAIINKKIFTGGDGNAMEPGHIPSRNGRVLERNIGKKELLDLANLRRSEFNGETQLSAEGDISTTGLVAAAAENDELALQIWNEVGEMLGEGLATLIKILDIKQVLIGGGLSASFDYILPAVNKTLDYWLNDYYKNGLLIRRATLGNDAGLLGAASLCFE